MISFQYDGFNAGTRNVLLQQCALRLRSAVAYTTSTTIVDTTRCNNVNMESKLKGYVSAM